MHLARFHLRPFASLLIAAGFIACSHSTGSVELNAAESCRSDAGEMTLGPGDSFDVRVYDEDGISGTHRLFADGTINFPLIGALRAEGQTPPKLAETIRQKLAEKYIRDPQVSIVVKDQVSKRISVLGEVSRPGSFAYDGSLSVVDAIALAGGFTASAQESATYIARSQDGRRFHIATDEHHESGCLLPGDVVYVPERTF